MGTCGLQVLVGPCAVQVLDAQRDPVLRFGEQVDRHVGRLLNGIIGLAAGVFNVVGCVGKVGTQQVGPFVREPEHPAEHRQQGGVSTGYGCSIWQ